MQLDALTTPDALGHMPFDVEQLCRLELTIQVRIEEPDAVSAIRRIKVGGG